MDVLHQQHQMKRVGGRLLAAWDEMKVEAARLLTLSVDKKASASDLRAKFGHLADDILEQPGPQAPSFVCNINAQAGEKRNRLWVPPCTLAKPLRSVSG